MAQQTPPTPPTTPPPEGGGGHLVWLAAVLSLVCAGVGQIYNGQTVKGIVLIAVYVVGWTLTSILSAICIGVLFIPFMMAIDVAAIVDAVLIAQKVAAGKQVGDWEFF